MADGYIERRFAEYEKRKAEWLKKQKRRGAKPSPATGGRPTAAERHANDDIRLSAG